MIHNINTLKMVHYLTLEENGEMRWDDRKSKVGSRQFRHRAGRVVKRYCRLPVTVLVHKVRPSSSSFYFKPDLVNGSGEMVYLYYKDVMIAAQFKEVSLWIQTFITSNKMYEQPMFQTAI